jgi:uncharacterized Tic20 family protein
MGGHFVVMLVLIGLYALMPIIAAVACALGCDFHYPILGRRLARYVEYDASADGQLIADHEDRFVAAMGHFAVIIPLWGMLAPLTAWISQGKKSLFIRFQSLQTLVFQMSVTVLFFCAGFVYFFGFMIFLGTFGLNPDAALNESTMIGLAVFGISMLCVVGIILIVPFLHILGQWAGYRVLKGDNYRYPLIGKLVERRLAKSYGVHESAPASSGDPLDSTKEIS